MTLLQETEYNLIILINYTRINETVTGNSFFIIYPMPYFGPGDNKTWTEYLIRFRLCE